jgi:hypothetical protein
MTQIAPTSTQPPVSPGPTVERKIATALWNQDERDRIIAMKAYELLCSRGCEHGSDLDDWLSAERELSSAADDVMRLWVHLPYVGNASEPNPPVDGRGRK